MDVSFGSDRIGTDRIGVGDTINIKKKKEISFFYFSAGHVIQSRFMVLLKWSQQRLWFLFKGTKNQRHSKFNFIINSLSFEWNQLVAWMEKPHLNVKNKKNVWINVDIWMRLLDKIHIRLVLVLCHKTRSKWSKQYSND